MQKVTRNITVDLSRRSNVRIVFATQNDLNSRRLLITLTDDGKPYAASKSLTATVNFKCADQSQWSYLATVLDDGKLEYTISPNVLAVSGQTQATVSLFDGAQNKLTSSPFVIDVAATLYPESELSDEAQLSYVNEMIGRFAYFQSQENTRQENENVRQENEGTRQQNETQRQEYYKDLDECLEMLEELQDKMIEAGANGSMILTTALDAYPVGSVYMSLDAKSPAELFGGVWEQIKDRFLLGAGGTYSAGASGGSTAHDHGLENGFAKFGANVGAGFTYIDRNESTASWKPTHYFSGEPKYSEWGYDSEHNYTIGAGVKLGGKTNDTSALPPYLAVYMWKRIA